MTSVGYRGIAFTPTGKALVLLENGNWLTLTAAQGERLMRARAEDGLPPVPVIDPAAVLPPRESRRRRARRPGTTNVELPPSLITQPLVLWRGPRLGSLTCERVITYPDGFEIELRAQALLVEDAEMPWGRSSRGFHRFSGLQLTVAFGDGRAQRVDDLTAEAQEGNVTVSPFRRYESSQETLWLWVMPSPPDGRVRLTATWSLHGIERAAVDLDVAPR